MIKFTDIAARLDNDEKLNLKYRMPVDKRGRVEWVERIDPLLDIAEDSKILYVDRDGEPSWVKAEEVIEVVPAE